MALLEIRNLTKSFKSGFFGPTKEVVRGVSLDVHEGEIVGLLGKNGAGKTTTFRMISGLLRPDTGTVTFDNKDVGHMPMYKRARMGMGYLPQERSVFLRLNVKDNIAGVLEAYPLSASERNERVTTVMEEMGIAALATRRLDSGLSGGELRRVEIARALALEPRMLLFDEPFTGLDPQVIDDLTKVILDLRERRKLAVFIIDHNVRETLRAATRIYIMGDGLIKVHGSPEEILNSADARLWYLGEHFEK